MRGEVREIIGAVDETFLERMILVFMDSATGYLVLEEVADDRTYATWKALVDERLKVLGTGVLYLVSDRAKALIQLAEKGLECLSMPDFFHVIHEIIKSYSLAIGRHLRPSAPGTPPKPRKPWPEPSGTAPGRLIDDPEATAVVAARQAEVQRLGRGPAHLSTPPGDALAHPASVPHRRLDAPDVRPGGTAGCTRQWTPSKPWPDAISCRHVPTP